MVIQLKGNEFMKKKHGLLIREYLYAVLFVVLAVILDQFTKYMAVVHLKDKKAIPLIEGVFELQYLENRGAAFGIMQNQQTFFIVTTILIMAAIVYLYNKIPKNKKYYPLKVCMILVSAGAIGNLIDRMLNNYVVDFFYFKLIDFPIFNVADCYVVVACILFIFLILFYYKEEDLTFISLKNGEKKE